jgi:hypothetical protein
MRRGIVWLVCLWLVVLSFGWQLNAQDSASTTQGFYVVATAGGTLTEISDGTYELKLTEVPALLDWMVSSPEYFAGGYDTALLVAEWSANTDELLTTTAMLRLEDVILRMTVGKPAYDTLTGELTLEATAVEAFPLEEDSKKKGGSIPDEFEAGTLTLVLDPAFDTGLIAGATILEEEGRVSRDDDANRPGPPRQERPGN